MKNIIKEFKTFITRGNVVDMAVGVIVGSSFTAIVNGMSNFILKPIINYVLYLCFGDDSLSDIYTFFTKVYTTEEILNDAGEVIGTQSVIDLANSIYIDWGSFINAVINFFLVAIVLFTIVKIINKVRENNKEILEKIVSQRLTKAQRAEIKAHGIKLMDRDAIEAYFAEKARKEKEAAEAKAAAEAEAARLEREKNPTTEDLLKQILAELQKK